MSSINPRWVTINPMDWRAGTYVARVDQLDAVKEPPLKKLEKDEIRVLKLHPGAGDEELRCSIRTCVLDATAAEDMHIGDNEFHEYPFEAVSYVWGVGDRKHVLKCNRAILFEAEIEGETRLRELWNAQVFDTLVPITENVRNLLFALRDATAARSLWIDGICINQDDHQERSEQVKRMRTIFSYAEKVIVWLGNDKDDSTQKGFFAAQKLASIYRDKTLWQMGLSRRAESGDWQSHGFQPWILSRTDPLYLDHSTYAALRDDLLRAEAFKRTWIYQELALGREVVLRWANEEISWEMLEDATRAIVGLSLPISSYHSGHQAVLNMAKKRNAVKALREHVDSESDSAEVEGGTELLLEQLLYDGRSLQVKDPHDKVYGMLGLLSVTDDPYIEVDYNAPVRGTYLRIAQHLLQTPSPGIDQPLRVLSYVQRQNKDLHMPSWVPDWNEGWITYCICFMGDFHAATARDVKYAFLSQYDIATKLESGNQQREPRRFLQIAGVKILTIDRLFGLQDFRKQAKILNRMPTNYPQTNSTYSDVYDHLFSTKSIGDIPPVSHRDKEKSYWRDCPDLINHANNGPWPWSRTRVDHKGSTTTLRITSDMLQARFTNMRGKGSTSKPRTREIDRLMHDQNWRVGFVSTNGFMGMVPKTSLAGDRIVLLLGGTVPFVIREVENGLHELVGECYVFGLMDGEGFEDLVEGRIEDILLR